MRDPDRLRRIRNDLPMPGTIAALGRDGPPSKWSEGHFRFLCPSCSEMQATVNPRNNLAHGVACRKNLNTIALLMTPGYDFRTAPSPSSQACSIAIRRDDRNHQPHRRPGDGTLAATGEQVRRGRLLLNSQQFGKRAFPEAKPRQR